MEELEGLRLVLVPCHALRDITIDLGHFLGRQPQRVEAPKILVIRLAWIDHPVIFGEEVQERAVPADGAMLRIILADADRQHIE